MSKNNKFNYRRPEKGRNRPSRPKGREHRITVRSVRKSPPDLRLIGRAAIAAALADASAEKAADDAQLAETNIEVSSAETAVAATQEEEIADDD